MDIVTVRIKISRRLANMHLVYFYDLAYLMTIKHSERVISRYERSALLGEHFRTTDLPVPGFYQDNKFHKQITATLKLIVWWTSY